MRSLNVPGRASIALAATWWVTSLAACTAVVDGSENTPMASGGSGASGASGAAGSGGTGLVPSSCMVSPGPAPASAPLRRLTQFEYNNTLRDLASAAAAQLPAEDKGNLFATDVTKQSISLSLIKAYHESAQAVAAALTTDANRIPTVLAPCALAPAAADEASCARTVVDTFVPRAYRRALAAGEAERYVQLFQTVRSSGQSFPASLAAVVEAVLQSPDFLYRQELGVPVEGRTDVRRLSDTEVAVRLSYLIWGSKPDDALMAAAAAGQLQTPEQVKAAATRLLADDKARDVVRYFFDSLLPIQGLASLQRPKYPNFNGAIGALMRTEVSMFLDKEVFEGSGTWPGILTAQHTYLNADLAAYYGLPAPPSGSAFQKVLLDGVKRGGLLTLGGITAGATHSNNTNPVTRGALVVKKLLCEEIPLPPGELGLDVQPPAEDLAPTARERYTIHSADQRCRGCHVNMDPVGFALENFDAIGLWRDQENGVTIDATGESPLLGAFNGPVELGQKLAASEQAQACFAKRWVDFGYGRTTDVDNCSLARVQEQFKAANYDVRQLLLELTQTDDFLYLKVEQP